MDSYLFAGPNGYVRLPRLEELDFYANQRTNLIRADGPPGHIYESPEDERNYTNHQLFVQMRGHGTVEGLDATSVHSRISPLHTSQLHKDDSDVADREAASTLFGFRQQRHGSTEQRLVYTDPNNDNIKSSGSSSAGPVDYSVSESSQLSPTETQRPKFTSKRRLSDGATARSVAVSAFEGPNDLQKVTQTSDYYVCIKRDCTNRRRDRHETMTTAQLKALSTEDRSARSAYRSVVSHFFGRNKGGLSRLLKETAKDHSFDVNPWYVVCRKCYQKMQDHGKANGDMAKAQVEMAKNQVVRFTTLLGGPQSISWLVQPSKEMENILLKYSQTSTHWPADTPVSFAVLSMINFVLSLKTQCENKEISTMEVVGILDWMRDLYEAINDFSKDHAPLTSTLATASVPPRDAQSSTSPGTRMPKGNAQNVGTVAQKSLAKIIEIAPPSLLLEFLPMRFKDYQGKIDRYGRRWHERDGVLPEVRDADMNPIEAVWKYRS